MEKSENDKSTNHSHVKGKKNVDHARYLLILKLKLILNVARIWNGENHRETKRFSLLFFSSFLLILTLSFCKVCITIPSFLVNFTTFFINYYKHLIFIFGCMQQVRDCDGWFTTPEA